MGAIGAMRGITLGVRRFRSPVSGRRTSPHDGGSKYVSSPIRSHLAREEDFHNHQNRNGSDSPGRGAGRPLRPISGLESSSA